jgi:glycosyltransferase involved in cell wall biosynthesis
MTLDCFASVVAPVRNDSAIIEAFIRETIPILRDSFKNYELILVDDGSMDETVAKVKRMLGQFQGIRLVRLSRQFGEEVAISAGLESVIGDFVVVMLPFMDPPRLIPTLVERSMAGVDVVFGVSSIPGNKGWFYSTCSKLFFWYCERFLQLQLPRNSTQLRCLSRKALNAITKIKDSYRYLRHFSCYVGYEHQQFVYTPICRGAHRHQRSVLAALNTGVDLIVENSRHPLRAVTWTGVAAGVINIAYILMIALIYFFKSDLTRGWTSLSLQSAGQFFLLTLMFTILSEYVGRILERLRDRPFYYVMDEMTSSVPLEARNRFNVVTEPTETFAAVGVGIEGRDRDLQPG